MARKHSTKSTVKTGRAPAQARSGPKKKAVVALEEPGLELDEVDAYHAERDRIRLEAGPSAIGGYSDNDDENAQQEVFGLGMSDEDSDAADYDDEEYREILRKTPGLRQHLGGLEDEEKEDVREDEDLDVMAWGKRKNLYYDDDAEHDDDAALEEEREALRLQKERAAAMSEEDFLDGSGLLAAGDDSLGGRVACMSKGRASATSVQKVVDDANDAQSDGEEEEEHEILPKDLSHLSKEEIMQHITAESPEFFDLLADFRAKTEELQTQVSPLLDRVRRGDAPMAKGVSLLELKNQLLLNYCLNLAFYFYLKADGRRVKDHPVIEKLVELRLYLDKVKPIEQKMKYQIDKLVKAAVCEGDSANGGAHAADALAFRPNPANLVADGASDNEGDEDGAAAAGGDGVYKAPRIAPVPFEEDPAAEDRRRKAADRARKQASSSRLMKDLMAEVTDMPEEVVDAGNMLVAGSGRDREWEDRVRAEEEMMMRLPVSRVDKKKMREQNKFANELENLDDFGDLSYLNDLDVDAEEGDGALAASMGSAGKKKKSLRSIIRRGLDEDEDAARSKRKAGGGDDDIPYRERKMQRGTTAGEDYNRHLDSDGGAGDHDDDRLEDDAMYTAAQTAKYERKKQRSADFDSHVKSTYEADAFGADAPLDAAEKRSVNYQIMKNKGLTPARKKEQRNPRVKHRKKFEKSLVKLKSFKSVVKERSGAYQGEETGIKKNLARSVKF